MSVKRYSFKKSWPSDTFVLKDSYRVAPDGDFVKYSDYAALLATNERLRKAGDAMAIELEPSLKWNPNNDDIRYQVRLWNAAKEGKQS